MRVSQTLFRRPGSRLADRWQRYGPVAPSETSAPKARGTIFGTMGMTVKSSTTLAFAKAFTLIELLVVIAIIALISALIFPAFNALGGAQNVTSAGFDLSGTLQTAKNYAVSHNTYVWVGFFEENIDGPTGAAGTGKLVISTVASKDGTRPATATLAASNLVQIGRLLKISNVHLGTVASPSPGSPLDGSGVGLINRPAVGDYRIAKDTPVLPSPSDQFTYPLTGTAQYQFVKTILFTPRSEAILNGDTSAVPWLEVGLLPTHGNVLDVNSSNSVALQVAGMTGDVRVYRP